MPPAEPFFPPRAERGLLLEVIADFPFPLALTYQRLHLEMDRQEPIAAAWQPQNAACQISSCASSPPLAGAAP